MANSILVTATQRGSGKSTVALGLVNQLEGSIPRVGYFKPIGMAGPNGVEPDVQLMKEALGLPFTIEQMVPTTMDQVQEALSNNSFDSLLDKILEAYENIARECDFVVCEGTDYLGAMAAFEFNINADISKNLGAPILLVANAQDCKGNLGNGCQFCESMIEHIVLAKESFDEKSCEVFGVIVNRVDQAAMKDIEKMARTGLKKVGIRLLGTLPKADMLSKLRVEEIADALGAEVLSGKDRMAILAQEIVVAAMNVENALERMPRGSLVLTPGDQNGMLLGLAAAFMSPAVPAPAGVVITGGMAPNPKVKEVFIDVTNGRLPLMQVDTSTYDTALHISQLEPKLAANQKLRIEVTKTLIDQNVNIEPLLARSAVEPSSKNLTPKQFIHKMMSIARSNPKRIVLPEGKEERILKAAHVLLHRGIVKLTLLGKEDQIQRQLARIGLTLEGDYEIIDPETSELRAKFAKRYQELRAPKHHPTDETAFERMGEPAYFGTMMVQEGLADGMVSGSITTTAATLRPALEFVKTKPGCSIASSVFFMCLPNQVLVYGDCAVNPNPTAEMLADIALASAETASSFGVDPYVAMLSYSTGASGTGSDVEKVRAATEIVKKTNPELPVEGPIQYDAAVDPGVAKTKLPDSRVAGAASVMIFPDLNTGNNTYKAVQRSANAIAIGPVMQGLNKPVNDLSRGCTIPDIINTVAITAIQAQRS